MPTRTLRFIAPLLALALATPTARAHFLWLTIRGHDAEQAVLKFTEGRFDTTMPMLIPSIERAEVMTPGGALELAPGAGGLAAEAPEGMDLFGAHLVYGIFGRSTPATLLVYDAKGARHLEAAGRKLGLEVELLAHRDGNDMVLTVLDGGVPAPGAQVVIVEDGTFFEDEYETGEDGTVRMPFPTSTIFYARGRVMHEGSGEWDGNSYDGISRYATLTIERLNAPSIPSSSDIEAWLVVEGAELRREALPSDVIGVTGGVGVLLNGVRHSADFTILGGAVEVFECESLSDAERPAAIAMLERAMEPLQRPAIDFRGGVTVAFGPENNRGRGHHVVASDGAALRIREHLIEEVRRPIDGGTEVHTVAQTMESVSGRLLPIAESRVRFDATGRQSENVLITRDFSLVEDAEIPTSYREIHVGAHGTVHSELVFDTVDLVRGGAR